MTTMVRLVERDGLVRRERDPADARALRVYLTDRGERLRPVAARALADLEASVEGVLGRRGLSELRRSLKGVMELWLFPTRVVELPGGASAFTFTMLPGLRRSPRPRRGAGGASAFTFTMLQAPGTPDELFEAQHASLVRELENVERRFSG